MRSVVARPVIERYAKLTRHHIAKTGSTVREIWKLMEQGTCDKANVGNRTAAASLFRAAYRSREVVWNQRK